MFLSIASNSIKLFNFLFYLIYNLSFEVAWLRVTDVFQPALIKEKMGFEVERFKEPPPDDLLCVVCNGALDDPVHCDNNHNFCRDCIMKWSTTINESTGRVVDFEYISKINPRFIIRSHELHVSEV